MENDRTGCWVMSGSRPEPNFGRLVSEEDLQGIVVSAHALRRFVERLRPEVPGADQVAEAMARLEGIGSGNRSGPEQGQLNRYRDWMATHVEPVVLDLICCEGFWATDRPRWSLSRTPSDGYLQVGRMCLFPAVTDGRQIVLTTCTNGRETTWAMALDRGYTLMPKPYTGSQPASARPPGLFELLRRAWRTRREHSGLSAAFRVERANTIQAVQQQNAERQATFQAATDEWRARRDRAHRVFRERHQGR
jgi:hypothetical protein